MALFRRTPLPGPEAPIAEHLDAILAGRDGAVAGYIQALAARDLWMAAAELPSGVSPGETWTATEPTTLRVLSTTMPDGRGRALQVFTSEAGVHRRSPASVPLKEAGRSLLERVVRDYDGAVVDPHDRWQGLAAAWIADAVR